MKKKEKTEKQEGNKKMLYGVGILFFGSLVGIRLIGDNDAGMTVAGISQLIGIVFILLGLLQRGSFDNAGEQIESYRALKGQCPKCGKKIGYAKFKCPYCTADL
jgi:hypothetical protein